MTINYNIRVSVKAELKQGLIFGLRSRLPIAVILGFLGHRHEVVPILQSLSHGTRAYIINADGLPGFLNSMKFIDFLREADKKGQLEHLKKWQVFDIEIVLREMKAQSSIELKMEYLGKHYPSLYRFSLNHLRRNKELE